MEDNSKIWKPENTRGPSPLNSRELPFALAVFVVAFLAQMGLLLAVRTIGWEPFPSGGGTVGLGLPLILLALFTLKMSFRDGGQRLRWVVGGVVCALAGTIAVMLAVALLPGPDPDAAHGGMLSDLVGMITGIVTTTALLALLAWWLRGAATSNSDSVQEEKNPDA